MIPSSIVVAGAAVVSLIGFVVGCLVSYVAMRIGTPLPPWARAMRRQARDRGLRLDVFPQAVSDEHRQLQREHAVGAELRGTMQRIAVHGDAHSQITAQWARDSLCRAAKARREA